MKSKHADTADQRRFSDIDQSRDADFHQGFSKAISTSRARASDIAAGGSRLSISRSRVRARLAPSSSACNASSRSAPRGLASSTGVAGYKKSFGDQSLSDGIRRLEDQFTNQMRN